MLSSRLIRSPARLIPFTPIAPVSHCPPNSRHIARLASPPGHDPSHMNNVDIDSIPRVALPPPRPEVAHITHYHMPSTGSDLCAIRLKAAADSRRGGNSFKRIIDPYPLDMQIDTVNYPGEPSPSEWQTIRQIMYENAAEKSMGNKTSAILITSLDDSQSKIPKKFYAPMVVNWTMRRVCYGPVIFGETEAMVNEMKDAQVLRLQAEELYAAEMKRLGRPRTIRQKRAIDKMQIYETIIVSSFLALAGWSWLKYRERREAEAEQMWIHARMRRSIRE